MNLEKFRNTIMASEGFSKEGSDSLLKVDAIMVVEFFAGCAEFSAPKIHEVEACTLKSNAIRYTQDLYDIHSQASSVGENILSYDVRVGFFDLEAFEWASKHFNFSYLYHGCY